MAESRKNKSGVEPPHSQSAGPFVGRGKVQNLRRGTYENRLRWKGLLMIVDKIENCAKYAGLPQT